MGEGAAGRGLTRSETTIHLYFKSRVASISVMTTDVAPISPTGRRFEEDLLLDAARAVFHRDGYSDAQISDIAQRAGTTKPTLYARLGNKQEIYLRVLQREVSIGRAWFAEAYERGVDLPLEHLAQIGMEPLFRFAVERSEGFDLLFRGEKSGDQTASLRREVVDDVTRQLTALIERRQRSVAGPPLGVVAEGQAAACVGVALQVCLHAIDHGNDLDDAQRLAARFVEVAMRGLAPGGSSDQIASATRS